MCGIHAFAGSSHAVGKPSAGVHVPLIVRRLRTFSGVQTHVRLGLECLNLVANGVGAQQQVKIWKTMSSHYLAEIYTAICKLMDLLKGMDLQYHIYHIIMYKI